MKVSPLSKSDKAELMASQALYLGLMRLQTLCEWFEMKHFQGQWVLTAWSKDKELLVCWKNTPTEAVSYTLRLVEKEQK